MQAKTELRKGIEMEKQTINTSGRSSKNTVTLSGKQVYNNKSSNNDSKPRCQKVQSHLKKSTMMNETNDKELKGIDGKKIKQEMIDETYLNKP